MKHMTKLLLIAALAAIAITPAPGFSHTGRVAAVAPAAVHVDAGAPTLNSWWGAAARAGCRQGFQYIGTPALLVATAATSLPAPSRAHHASAAPAASAVSDTPGPRDHWWGAAGAVACGLCIRGWPAFGGNPGYNAIMVVACVTVLLDALV